MCRMCLALQWKIILCLFPGERVCSCWDSPIPPGAAIARTPCLVWPQGVHRCRCWRATHAAAPDCPGCSLLGLSKCSTAAAREKFPQACRGLRALLPPRTSGEEFRKSRVCSGCCISTACFGLLAAHVPGAGAVAQQLHVVQRLLTRRLPVGTHACLGLWFRFPAPRPAPGLCSTAN